MPSWFGKLRYAGRRHGPTDLLWLVAYNAAYHRTDLARGGTGT